MSSDLTWHVGAFQFHQHVRMLCLPGTMSTSAWGSCPRRVDVSKGDRAVPLTDRKSIGGFHCALHRLQLSGIHASASPSAMHPGTMARSATTFAVHALHRLPESSFRSLFNVHSPVKCVVWPCCRWPERIRAARDRARRRPHAHQRQRDDANGEVCFLGNHEFLS